MNQKIPYRYRILLFLFFLTFITYLDRICISLVGVRIKSEFSLTNEQFGWILASFSLAYAIFEIPSGVLGDRIGQRKVLIRIVLWWSLFTALTGLTTGFISLVIVRFLFGMGESGAFPNSGGVVARWFPVDETSRGVSWFTFGSNAGAAVAPFIVVPIAVAFGWRAPFFVNALIGLLWVAVCIYWFRNHPSEMKGIPEDEKIYIEKNRRVQNHKQHFDWAKTLKNRSVWGLLISFYTTQWALYFFVAWMPVYLQEGRHFSESGMKMITSWLFVFGALSCLVAGFAIDWLVKRKGLRIGRKISGVASVGIMALVFFIAAITPSNTVVAICFFVGNFFLWHSIVCAVSVCVDIGGERAATLYGLMNFVGQVGAFFLAVTFGKIVDATHNFNTPIHLIAALLVVGSLSWLLIQADKPLIEGDKSLQSVT
jgi:ACS family glucarate transporter-like MFS transporter